MNNRYRFSPIHTLFAGLAGAIAWGLPFLMSPLLYLIPFMPRLPVYESPPFQIYLGDLTFSFFLAGMIAGGFFLLVLRFLPMRSRDGSSRPALGFSTVLSVLLGMAIGGAVAISFGLVTGYSQAGRSLAFNLDFFDRLPDPYLSIGLVIGTALTAIIICSFPAIGKQFASRKDSPIKNTLEIAGKVSGIALLVRFITYIIEYSSLIKYTVGDSVWVFMLFQAASGALFGILAWTYCSRLKVIETTPQTG